MPVELTHVGEAVVSKMIAKMRWEFIDLCGLQGLADESFVSDQSRSVVSMNVNLVPYSGIAFDGASCVDLVLRIKPNLGVPFELKLGETRLTKSRVDEDWLQGCDISHQGTRFKGNMISVLERKFPATVPPDVLMARFFGDELPLTPEWVIIARSRVIDSWSGAARPNLSSNVHLVSFEAIVDRFGGREPFNEMVQTMLNFDYYSEWVNKTK